MRIQSNFHDYYDAVMSHGFDTTMVYKRFPETESLERWSFPVCCYNHQYGGFSLSRNSVNITQYAIGFCGKVYPVLGLNKSPRSPSSKDWRNEQVLVFSLEDVDNYVKRTTPECFDHYSSNKHYIKNALWDWNQRRQSFASFFESCSKKEDAFSSLFEEKQCPIFVVTYEYQYKGWNFYKNDKRPRGKETYGTLTWNACLKPYEFFRIKDSYQAFQELSMWLGNQAEPRKPIPPISDETMVEIKGFDKKTSFRKDPQK